MDLAATCEVLHQLPRQGGVLDQDSFIMKLVQHALIARQKKAKKDRPAPK